MLPLLLILTLLVELFNHPVAPALVAPLHEPVKETEGVDEPQVVLQVVDQRAVRLGGHTYMTSAVGGGGWSQKSKQKARDCVFSG